VTASEREVLIEQVLSAHRERDDFGRILSHPAWHDLAEADRAAAFDAAAVLRRIEATLDPEGLSTTARAVLEQIRGS